MFHCPICGSTQAQDDRVSEVFQVNGNPVLIEEIPAKVCSQCGEATFSRETTEAIRQMLQRESEL